MPSFLNYRDVDFKIDSKDFYATSLSLSAQASVDPVLLSDGSLLDYAPSSAVIGSLSCEFYLTGALPEFLNITGSHDSAMEVKFADVELANVYAKSISFSVEPFQPILISAEFDWYGDVKVEDFKEQNAAKRKEKQTPEYVANALRSSISETNSEFIDRSFDRVVSFSYSASCDRPVFFNADEKLPFRVAKINKKCDLNLSSNNLGKLVSIDGKRVQAEIELKDFYGESLNTFIVSGVLMNQNYNVSNNNYMLAEAAVMQDVQELKTFV